MSTRQQEFVSTNKKRIIFSPKSFLVVLIIIIVVTGGALGLNKVFNTESKTEKIGFEDIGELATQVAYCTEVNVTEAAREFFGVAIPFTQSKYIYSYDVEIKAGLDFGKIEWELDEENAVIQVRLPEIQVLSNSIKPDSFKLYHENESIFRRVTLEENNEALTNLAQRAEEDAVGNGLLENARANAETILKGFFANVYDMEQYKVEFIY